MKNIRCYGDLQINNMSFSLVQAAGLDEDGGLSLLQYDNVCICIGTVLAGGSKNRLVLGRNRFAWCTPSAEQMMCIAIHNTFCISSINLAEQMYIVFSSPWQNVKTDVFLLLVGLGLMYRCVVHALKLNGTEINLFREILISVVLLLFPDVRSAIMNSAHIHSSLCERS